jgi:hypothetical protein
MSGRRPNCDSGEPDLWSNGSVFEEPSEPISIDPSPHIPLQHTTVKASPLERERVRAADGHIEPLPYVIPAQAGIHCVGRSGCPTRSDLLDYV